MNRTDLVYVAGHQGLVGSAIVRRLRQDGYDRLLLRTRRELDLRDQSAVDSFFKSERPSVVFLSAAKVGGIFANNTQPADFIRDNLQIQTNVIDAAYRVGCEKFVFLGSSCIYPKHAPQPMPESCLLTGPLEPTNEWYAIAKIAGLKMCQAYRRQYGFNAISLMPTNLYGPGDNFSLESSHVLPALIRKFHEAKMSDASEVVVWGTGTPRREFLHADDFAAAAVYLAHHYESEQLINIGWGVDTTIAELAQIVREIVEFHGTVVFDPSKPDGTPRKLLDVSALNKLGWHPSIDLRGGIASSYKWFLDHQFEYRH